MTYEDNVRKDIANFDLDREVAYFDLEDKNKVYDLDNEFVRIFEKDKYYGSRRYLINKELAKKVFDRLIELGAEEYDKTKTYWYKKENEK